MKKLFLVLVCAVLFSATFVLSSYKTNDNNVPTEELTAMSDDCDEYTCNCHDRICDERGT